MPIPPLTAEDILHGPARSSRSLTVDQAAHGAEAVNASGLLDRLTANVEKARSWSMVTWALKARAAADRALGHPWATTVGRRGTDYVVYVDGAGWLAKPRPQPPVRAGARP